MTKIAIREITTYQTDDGNKIEKHKVVLRQESISKMDKELYNQIKDMIEKDVLFWGFMTIETSLGISEEKFYIPADNLQEAYENFAIFQKEEVQKIKKQMEKDANQIVMASQQDVQLLDSVDSGRIITD